MDENPAQHGFVRWRPILLHHNHDSVAAIIPPLLGFGTIVRKKSLIPDCIYLAYNDI